MKKLALSLIVVAMFAVYSIYSHGSFGTTFSPDQSKLLSPILSMQSPSETNTPPLFFSGTEKKYKNGSYTGIIADAFYGPLQVKAVISQGRISDVQFLQYPNDQDRSLRISEMSMPQLKSSAIQKQDSNVDIVSGATDTSQAFRESLASALTQAK